MKSLFLLLKYKMNCLSMILNFKYDSSQYSGVIFALAHYENHLYNPLFITLLTRTYTYANNVPQTLKYWGLFNVPLLKLPLLSNITQIKKMKNINSYICLNNSNLVQFLWCRKKMELLQKCAFFALPNDHQDKYEVLLIKNALCLFYFL